MGNASGKTLFCRETKEKIQPAERASNVKAGECTFISLGIYSMSSLLPFSGYFPSVKDCLFLLQVLLASQRIFFLIYLKFSKIHWKKNLLTNR